MDQLTHNSLLSIKQFMQDGILGCPLLLPPLTDLSVYVTMKCLCARSHNLKSKELFSTMLLSPTLTAIPSQASPLLMVIMNTILALLFSTEEIKLLLLIRFPQQLEMSMEGMTSL